MKNHPPAAQTINPLIPHAQSRFSPGRCRLCGQLFDKARVGPHLKACAQPAAAASPQAAPAGRCVHLLVEAKHNPGCWLHLEVPAKTPFGRLDRVLREIWLECCGHMSAFRFPRKRRPSASSGDSAAMFAALAQRGFEDGMEAEQRLMGVAVGTRLQPGAKLEDDYDFGSTTELAIRVLDERPGSLSKPKIRLLARNEPPDLRCARCGEPATQICAECDCSGEGALCEGCAAEHACGEALLLPVVNSPRTGLCGYCGPSVEP